MLRLSGVDDGWKVGELSGDDFDSWVEHMNGDDLSVGIPDAPVPVVKMTGVSEQRVMGLLAALLGEGCGPSAIEAAVARTLDTLAGDRLSGLAHSGRGVTAIPLPLVRAWISEQAGRLARA